MFLLADFMVIFAVGSLLAASAGMAVLRFNRRPLSAMWLSAFGGVGLAWITMVLARLFIPHQVQLIPWQKDALLTGSITLSLDTISWTYGAALSSLGLSVILTAVSRLEGVNWRAWFGMLILEAIGLVAVLAGNPVTLLVAWSALDLVELITWQIQVKDPSIRQRVIVTFSGRVIGTVLLMVAVVFAQRQGGTLTFDAIAPQAAPLLILAIGFRLGVVPLQPPFLAENALRQGVGTMLRLAPSTAALSLLVRVANAQLSSAWSSFFIVFTLIAAFYSALAWMNAPDELAGRPFWVMLTASLAVMAAILNRPDACLAWSMVSIFSGGISFLSSIRHRNLLPVVGLAVIGLSMLPFTPVWAGVTIYGAAWKTLPWWAAALMTPVLLSVQVMLVMGFLRHSLRMQGEVTAPERWIWLVYPPGLAVLILGQFAIGWILQPVISSLTAVEWAASFSVTGLAGFFAWVQQRNPNMFSDKGLSFQRWINIWNRFFSLDWSYTLIGQVSRAIERFLALLNRTVEGRGGLLWALLWLIMFFSLTIQYARNP